MLKSGELIRAAKPHACKWCSAPIEKGEHYYFWSVHMGRHHESNRMHQECYGHYRKTTNGHYTPFVNKRHMTEQEVAAAENEIGLSYTVFIYRSSDLLRMTDDTRGSSSYAAHMFVCRVRARTSAAAVVKAVHQALAFDLATWNESPGHLFSTQPHRGHYSAVYTATGFPSLIRPE